jgi:hypothetical protein
MIVPAFVIFSASRSGSTTLFRALNLIPGVWAAYEPGFGDGPHWEQAVMERIPELLSDHSGFKHVFDPTGYPFLDIDWATTEEMDRNEPLWLKLNSMVLNYPGLRIIFLRRRNGFDRIVSDQIHKNTNIKNHQDSNVSADEPALYKGQISKLPLPPIDENLVRSYLTNLPRIQDQLRCAVTKNAVMDVWYEDLLGPDVPPQKRIERFAAIVEFLQVSAPRNFFDSPELSLLLSPAAKLNDTSIFERIPNYRELRKKFNVHDESCTNRTKAQLPGPVRGAPASIAGGNRSCPPGLASMEEGVVREPVKLRLRAAGDNAAGLVFPPDQPGAVRVAISSVTSASFDIQLNFFPLNMEVNRPYALHFRARADLERIVFIGVAQAHEPWMSLGLYERVQLSPEWRDYRMDFTASASDNLARIHFDLGERAISVEVSGVNLVKRDRGRYGGR